MKINKKNLRDVDSMFPIEKSPAFWGPLPDDRNSGGMFDRYHHHAVEMRRIVWEAKYYLQENWMKVKDWSELKIIIHDNKSSHIYYDHERATERMEASEKELAEANKDSSTSFKKMMDDLHEEQGHYHDPVRTVNRVVLDESDGDFSVDINGNAHLWIDNNAVMVLAYYVEKRLGWKTAPVADKKEDPEKSLH